MIDQLKVTILLMWYPLATHHLLRKWMKNNVTSPYKVSRASQGVCYFDDPVAQSLQPMKLHYECDSN